MPPPSESRIPELERRVAADPRSQLFVPLAEAYRRAGRLEEAERALRAGLAHHPSHPSARTALGRVLHQGGRDAEAREVLEAVVREVPDNLLAGRLLGEIRSTAPPDPGVPEPAPPRDTQPLELSDLRRAAEAESTAPEGEEPPRTVPPPAGERGETAGAAPAGPAGREPLPTEELSGPALAELYRARGQVSEALGIYREMQDRDPANPEWAWKVRELEGEAAGAAPDRETPGEQDRFDEPPEPLPDDVWEVEPEPGSATIPISPGQVSLIEMAAARHAEAAPGAEAARGGPAAGEKDPAVEGREPIPPGPPGAEEAGPPAVQEAAALDAESPEPAASPGAGRRARRLAALGRYLARIRRHGGAHAG